MNKRLRMCGLAATVLALLAVCPLGLSKAGQKASLGPFSAGTGLVNDSLTDKVRSDGRGLYSDGVDCVSVIVGGGGGVYQDRTVANTDVCNGELSWWSPNPSGLPTHRFLSLDFSLPVSPTTTTAPGDLDGNGAAETVEKAPARFIASTAFAQNPSTTAVQILVLKVNADGTTTQDTAWQLTYRNQATVTVNTDGSRNIFLGQGLGDALATADLCENVTIVGPGGRVTTQCQRRGTFDMPFFVTAAKK